MSGLNRNSGEQITSLSAHVRQSINDIVSTPLRSRIMRRDYGSVIPDLIDQPLNSNTLLRVYAATAAAVMRWEPRFKISRIQLFTAGAGTTAGQVTIEISGTLTTDQGGVDMTTTTTLEGVYL